jgi:hypothetical protein
MARSSINDVLADLEQSTISTVAELFRPEPEERRRERLESIAHSEAAAAAYRDGAAALIASSHPTFAQHLAAARKRNGLA